MEKNHTRKRIGKQRKVLMTAIAALSVILALLIGLLVYLDQAMIAEEDVPGVTGDSASEETANMKELLVQSVTEQEDTVLVVTTYGTVTYRYAFSDLIRVEAETFEDLAVLEFSATIDDVAHKLYTLFFNGKEGMPIGTLLVDGETYVVTAQFHDVSGISDDDMVTFYAAQETFNDVVNSLSENEGFTAED